MSNNRAPISLAGFQLRETRHVCAFFNSDEEEYRVLLPFIKGGFECGDKAVHVVNPDQHRDHLQRLAAIGIDSTAFQRSGQLELRTSTETYLHDGRFDQDLMLAAFEQMASGNAKGAFPLSRIVCRMDWASAGQSYIDDLIEFESRVNDVWRRHDDAVICTYHLSKFGGDVVLLRLGVQGEIGVLMAGSQRGDFPQPTESLLLSVTANQASIALQESRLLNQQRRMATELDQRVAQRTAELAAINEALKQEVAERKRAEEALRASEFKLRQVIDTIPALAWCNLPDGPNEFLNKGWHEYTGLSPEESHGWGWQAAFHPEDLPGLMERWLKMLVSGEPDEIEARLRRHDGVYRWFLIRAEPLRDETGEIVRWYGTSTDIDDRKRAEEQLRRSEAFLAEGQHLARIGNLSWRVATDEIVWSEQLYRIFQFDAGKPVTLELIGSRVHPEDIPMLNEMIDRARRGVSDFEYEYRLHMPDTSVKYLHLIAHGIRDSEGRLEYIGAVQDVTQRRASEEALAKARSEFAHVARVMSLGTLTASIAHEVNQPLSGILTNASTCLRMLSGDPPNLDGARETARRTIRDANRASDVITRLRALFNKKDASTEAVDLNDAVHEVIALSLSDLQRNRVILRPELADNLPSITGDRVQLQQVILNLLRNASEAMSTVTDRPRELLIKTQREEGDQVCLSVRDVGVGFDLQAIDRLFDAFYTTKHDGMGIGLSVSRSIVENHHGRLWASLNDGPGATFSFSIPCRANG